MYAEGHLQKGSASVGEGCLEAGALLRKAESILAYLPFSLHPHFPVCSLPAQTCALWTTALRILHYVTRSIPAASCQCGCRCPVNPSVNCFGCTVFPRGLDMDTHGCRVVTAGVLGQRSGHAHLEYPDSLAGACCFCEANVETDQIACTRVCLKLPVDSGMGRFTFSGA